MNGKKRKSINLKSWLFTHIILHVGNQWRIHRHQLSPVGWVERHRKDNDDDTNTLQRYTRLDNIKYIVKPNFIPTHSRKLYTTSVGFRWVSGCSRYLEMRIFLRHRWLFLIAQPNLRTERVVILPFYLLLDHIDGIVHTLPSNICHCLPDNHYV